MFCQGMKETLRSSAIHSRVDFVELLLLEIPRATRWQTRIGRRPLISGYACGGKVPITVGV